MSLVDCTKREHNDHNVEIRRINELTEAANGHHQDTNHNEDATISNSLAAPLKSNGHRPPSISNGYGMELSNLNRMQRKNDVIPFDLLPGEKLESNLSGKASSVFLTNFRLFVSGGAFFFNSPIRAIEYVEMRDPYGLHVHCKDGKVLRITFDTTEDCNKWSSLITESESSLKRIDDIFAFQYFDFLMVKESEQLNGLVVVTVNGSDALSHLPGSSSALSKKNAPVLCEASMYVNEIKRLGFNTDSIWRTTEINDKFEICETYPKYHIVPKRIVDKELEKIAQFRSMKRFPSVVWRNRQNGAVIARCSQPELGWFCCRSEEDEQLLSAIIEAAWLDSSTTTVKREHMSSSVSLNLKDCTTSTAPSLLLVDARSYTAAFANRAKGGGCEYQEYYPNCEIQFMSLPNIHAIRKSFHGVRTLCLLGQEQSNWYSALEATRWLQNLSALIKSACTIVEAVDVEGRSTLIHCSDGWDRTPQLASLAQLLLDPYYRTIKGFHVLIEREWLEFGHKFADRCGHSTEKEPNERSPVFFQWLDAIHQVLTQFPSAFEFNEYFLIKLLQHSYSCLYGTFLCNSLKERRNTKINARTKSVWDVLLMEGRKDFKNYLFDESCTEVLYPNYRVRCLNLWDNVFLGKNDYSSPSNLAASCSSSASSSSNLSTCYNNHRNTYTNPSNTRDSLSNGESRFIDPFSGLSLSNGTQNHKAVVSSPNSDEKLNGHLSNGFHQTNGHENDGGTANGGTAAKSDTSECDSLENTTNTTGLNKKVCIDSTSSTIDTATSTSDNNVCTNDLSVSRDRDDHVTGGDQVTERDECLVVKNENGTIVANNRVSVETTATTTHNGVALSDIYSNMKSVDTTMTDSCRTLTSSEHNYNVSSSSNEHRTSLDDLCLASGCGGVSGMESSSLEHHRTSNNIRRVYSSPESPTLNRLIRTKSVPDVMTTASSAIATSVCVSNDVCKQFPDLVDNETKSNCDYRCFIDGQDGLTRRFDALQQKFEKRLTDVETRHALDLQNLQRKLELERHARLFLQQQLSCKDGVNGVGGGAFNIEALLQDDLFSLASSTNGERSSLSSISNEEAWEQVQFDDVAPIRWLPDHVTPQCSNCGCMFSLVYRKHHCRKCGGVFCDSCSNHKISVPEEQLYTPVRVCAQCYSHALSHQTS